MFVSPEFPIRLYPSNAGVNQYNESQLRQIKDQLYTIVAMDTGKVKLEKPEPEITLCVGAQVMVTRNIDIANGICNGTIGIVKRVIYKGTAISS